MPNETRGALAYVVRLDEGRSYATKLIKCARTAYPHRISPAT